VRAEIRAREAAQRQAALGDAERALGDYDGGRDTLTRRQAALDASRRSFSHAEAGFAAGDITGVELLAALRLLHEAENCKSARADDSCCAAGSAYKAIGGGWGVGSNLIQFHFVRGSAINF
jgi:outer membrane protein TolC